MTSQTVSARPLRRARGVAAGGPRILPLLFFAALTIALFFAMIYLRIALDRNAFELDFLEHQIEVAESTQLDLRLEIAGLQNPLRISNEAQRIGLEHPKERVAIVVTARAEAAEPVDPEVPHQALDQPQP